MGVGGRAREGEAVHREVGQDARDHAAEGRQRDAREDAAAIVRADGAGHEPIALEAGVTLIEKPFSEPQLLAKIRDVLDSG